MNEIIRQYILDHQHLGASYLHNIFDHPVNLMYDLARKHAATLSASDLISIIPPNTLDLRVPIPYDSLRTNLEHLVAVRIANNPNFTTFTHNLIQGMR